MLFEKFPFDDQTGAQYNIFKKICACQYEFPEVFPPVDEDAIDLIKKLLTRDPKKRLGCGPTSENPEVASNNGFDKLKLHPFLKDVDYSILYKEKGLKVMKKFITKQSGSDSNMHTEGSSFSSSNCNMTVRSRKTIEILAKVDTKRKKFLLIEVSGHLILLSDNTIRYDQVYDNSSVGSSDCSACSR